MAIEAIAQISELKNIDMVRITSFDLQDVHLDAALLVPESGGVEVLFSLRPAKRNSKTYYETLYDITVTSVINTKGSDTFTEHCHGQVGLEVETTGMSLTWQRMPCGLELTRSRS